MAAVRTNFGWVFLSFDQLCLDNYTFPSFQGWVVVMTYYVLVQSRFFMLFNAAVSNPQSFSKCGFMSFTTVQRE